MSLYNDYLQQSEKAKFNAQQAALSGDKRLQDFYNSESEQLFIRAMNAKMQSDERGVEYQNYYAQQEQRKMQAEMQAQHNEIMRMERELQAERIAFEHECWFNSLPEKQQKLYLEKKQKEEEERLEAERIRKEEQRRGIEESIQKEAERRASMTPFQRKKEDILNSNAFAWIVASTIMFGGGTLLAMFF